MVIYLILRAFLIGCQLFVKMSFSSASFGLFSNVILKYNPYGKGKRNA